MQIRKQYGGTCRAQKPIAKFHVSPLLPPLLTLGFGVLYTAIDAQKHRRGRLVGK